MTVCSKSPPRTAVAAAVLAGVGANIAALRQRRGVSQVWLARQAGMDRAYLCGVEQGQRNPTVAVLARIAAALDTTVSALTVGVEASGAVKIAANHTKVEPQ